jgi:hypothetical protein
MNLSSEEKRELANQVLDELIFYVHLSYKETETKLPDFVEERTVPSDGTFYYSFKLGDLREYIKEVGCPTAGQFYLEWMDFAKLLRDVWMGGETFFAILRAWRL